MSLAIVRLGKMLTLSVKIANREDVERNSFHPLPTPPDTETAVAPDRYVDSPAPPRAAPHGQSFIGSVLRNSRYTGLSLETMEPQLAIFFGAPANAGLLVHAVDANSPGANSGLRAGDVVLRVDSVMIMSTSDWTKRLRAVNGKAVNLTILRGKQEQTVTLQPDYKKHSLLEWPSLF